MLDGLNRFLNANYTNNYLASAGAFVAGGVVAFGHGCIFGQSPERYVTYPLAFLGAYSAARMAQNNRARVLAAPAVGPAPAAPGGPVAHAPRAVNAGAAHVGRGDAGRGEERARNRDRSPARRGGRGRNG